MKTGTKIEWFLAVLLVATTLVPALALADGDDDETAPKELEEVTVALADLPEAVQATVLKESAGFELTELQEITTAEGVFYEAEWIDGDYEVEVKVAPDGQVLEREREKADEQEDDDVEGEVDG